MIYLDLEDILAIHLRAVQSTVGIEGIRDIGLLESAVSQPRQGFGGVDLYPTSISKAACLVPY